jgi:hypothetical protein
MYGKLLAVRGKQGGKLPLAFDTSYLKTMGNPATFMDNDEIRTWIGSVSHQVKDWYRGCMCDPANEADLRDAQSRPLQFADAVFQHEFKLSGSAKQSVGWRSVGSQKSAKEKDVVPDFVRLTGMVTRRIERDGQRGGAFARSKQSRHIRYAAIMLLVTVIMDLTVNMGYFIRLFLGVIDAGLAGADEQILMALGGASAGTSQPPQQPRGIGAVPRTLQVPADLFDAVSETFGNLPQSAGCRILVYPPSGAGLVRYIVLVGSAKQMDEAEKVTTKVMATSATPSGMDMP